MEEKTKKQSFYPDTIDATTVKGISEVIDHTIPLVTDMFNKLGGVPPTFIIGLHDNIDEHNFIIMTASNSDVMPILPIILDDLATRLGIMKQVNDIKQVDYLMFFAESTQVKIEKDNPEHMKVAEKLKQGMEASKAPENMKKDSVFITARNLNGKDEVRNLEVKQSINFIDKEMMSTTKSLVLDTFISGGELEKMDNKFSDLFFSSFNKACDENSSANKKFHDVLKAMGAEKEYEAIRQNKNKTGLETDRILSQIELVLAEIPTELKKKLIIKLGK